MSSLKLDDGHGVGALYSSVYFLYTFEIFHNLKILNYCNLLQLKWTGLSLTYLWGSSNYQFTFTSVIPFYSFLQLAIIFQILFLQFRLNHLKLPFFGRVKISTYWQLTVSQSDARESATKSDSLYMVGGFFAMSSFLSKSGY